MIRKEICGSCVKLVFYIDDDSLMAQVTFDHVDDAGRETAFFSANDFIELGQTLSSVEQGEAHDAVDELQGRLRELGNDILRVAEACPREHLDLSEHALEMLTNMNNPGGAK